MIAARASVPMLISPSVLADAVLHTSSDAIVASDKDGIIQFWNAGASASSATRAAMQWGSLWTLSFQSGCERATGKAIVRSWRQGKAGRATAMSLLYQASERTEPASRSNSRSVPVRDETSQMIGMVAIMRDVTTRFEEMRVLRQKIGAANKLPAKCVPAVRCKTWPISSSRSDIQHGRSTTSLVC